MKRIMILIVILSMLSVLSGCAEVNDLPENENIKNETKTNQIFETNIEQFIHYMNNIDVDVPEAMKKQDEWTRGIALSTVMSHWIESINENPIEIEEFSELYLDQYDPSILKLLKLNILSTFGEEDITNEEPILQSTAIQSMLAFSMYLDGSIYRNNKDYFTGEDLRQYYEYLLIVYKENKQEEKQFVDVTEILDDLGVDENEVITKKIFADFFVLMREATDSIEEEIKQYDDKEEKAEDEEDTAIQVMLDLKVYRPGQTNTIQTEHPLTFAEVNELLQRSLPYWNAFNQEDDTKRYITNEQVAELLLTIYERTADLDVLNKEKRMVDNGEDYGWYVSQLNTGDYSTVNALPADIAMIGQWYDEDFSKTVQDIRENNMNNGKAWTMMEAQNQLDYYNISYTKKAPSMESLIQTINEGGIALVAIDTQIVEHAVIVKGYEQQGEDIYLHIYDPALGDSPDEYGQPMGAHVIEHESIFEYKMKQKNEEILAFIK